MRLSKFDLHAFEVIQRHGWLPSHYIHALTKDHRRNHLGMLKRLKELVDAGYLNRPVELNNPLILNDFKCYRLTDKAKAVLEMQGKRQHYAMPPGGGLAHAAMTVAITANLELHATRAGFAFISQEEILRNAPHQTRNATFPLALPSDITYEFKGKKQHSHRPTIPDGLFGIDYGQGQCRFFAIEADRGTEIIEPTKTFQLNSLLRKLLAYDYILKRKEYQKRFDIPVLYPLFITTAEERAKHMIALAERLFKSSNHMLFTHVPGFDVFFRTPPLLPQLWERAWLRVAREPFLISKT